MKQAGKTGKKVRRHGKEKEPLPSRKSRIPAQLTFVVKTGCIEAIYFFDTEVISNNNVKITMTHAYVLSVYDLRIWAYFFPTFEPENF